MEGGRLEGGKAYSHGMDGELSNEPCIALSTIFLKTLRSLEATVEFPFKKQILSLQ